MKKAILVAFFAVLPIVIFISTISVDNSAKQKLVQLKERVQKKAKPGVDHSKLPELQKKFSSPQEVTKTCLSCHTERGKEVMKTPHWRWLSDEYVEGRGVVSIGKKNLLNNYCIAIGGSEGSCNKCHIGYGYDSKEFDFTDQNNIDCLACHSGSGTYVKGKEMAGNPDPKVDLSQEVKSITLPQKEMCGKCHFDGGGGNNSKHGDLDLALNNTDRSIDVHMGKNGGNMECMHCHTAENHDMKGKLFTVSSMNKNRMECAECHSESPHKSEIVNEHSVKVACQTCHIPTYAKVNATKVHWDWSKAGDLRDGKPYVIKNEDGNEVYQSIKGQIDWKKNLVPEYKWFKGTADHYLLQDTSSQFPIVLNPFKAKGSDPGAKIVPVKVMRTIQPYDPVNKRLVSPKVWDKEYGKGAFWKDFDWNAAIKAGMEYVDMPWSGQYSFVNTESNWILNHMVAPKEQALKCENCHTQNNSQIASIGDIYVPGRDRSFIDIFGSLMVFGTALGVFGHTIGRIYFNRKNKINTNNINTDNKG